PAPATTQELVLVLDFGSQYSQLIARRIREAGVYSELIPGTTPWAVIEARRPKALVLSGGPSSVYEPDAPLCDPAVFAAGVPLLGICSGIQLLVHQLGGRVAAGARRGDGDARVQVVEPSLLFRGRATARPGWIGAR